jgi:apolipoprotein N-acyltransferase
VAAPYLSTKDPEWYAEQAAQLRDEIERRNAQLDGYRQAIRDARTLETSTGGVNLDQGDIAITPETAVDILEQRVKEAQAKFDDLEDLARRNDIAPGTLRGQ